jgi:hypothetical protein
VEFLEGLFAALHIKASAGNTARAAVRAMRQGPSPGKPPAPDWQAASDAAKEQAIRDYREQKRPKQEE